MRYKMEILFPPDSELEVHQRILQLLCLIAGLFTTLVFVPANLLEHLPWLLSAGVFLFGLIFLGILFLARRRDIYLYKTVSLLLLLLMNFVWFFNCGSQGPTSLLFFSAAILFTVNFRVTFQSSWMKTCR